MPKSPDPSTEVLDPVTLFRTTRPLWMLPQDYDAYLVPATLDLSGISARQFRDLVGSVFPNLEVPILLPYLDSDKELDRVADSQIIDAFAPLAVIHDINCNGAKYSVADMETGALMRKELVMAHHAPKRMRFTPKPKKGEVVVAVVDDCIALGHEVFCSGLTASRVDYAYVMHARPSDAPANPPTKLRRGDIDAALVKHTRDGYLDEAAFYEELRIYDPSLIGFDPIARSGSHGTHIASLAAGQDGAGADNMRFICAMLPPTLPEDLTGSDRDANINIALSELAAVAKYFKVNAKTYLPVVMNLSFGSLAGPHDGSSLLARKLSEITKRAGKQLIQTVVPAGNQNLSQAHAVAQFDPNRSDQELVLQVLPDNHTATHVEFWLPFVPTDSDPNAARGSVQVTVTAPDGSTMQFDPANPANRVTLSNPAGQEVAMLTYTFKPRHTGRGCFVLSIHPTESLKSHEDLAAAGLWHVRFDQETLPDGVPIRAWVRNALSYPQIGHVENRSRFVTPVGTPEVESYQHFTPIGAVLANDPAGTQSPVRRGGTLNDLATGGQAAVIAGLVESTGELPVISASGPAAPLKDAKAPARVGPDAAMISDSAPARPGVIGAGNRRGSFTRLNGTSVSSAIATRYMAQAAAGGTDVGPDWLRAEADHAEAAGSFPTPRPSPERAHGRIPSKPPFGG